ncbi:hypothetical protein TIFTF001_025226 [Ficus carica]|uniref:F-box domain-containing protein n=1 Tax=Ficus carica TaxID=3494 RepID=A0AA88AJH5_FICCA|nr:hypothetical protein TIFTF001_025226 [Ficus carica]
MALFYNLPDDVADNIFLHLPADSLVRFKCVSKSWYALLCSLIKDPVFVAKNLQNFKNRSSSSLLISRLTECDERRFSVLTPLVYNTDNDGICSLIEDLNFPLCGDGRNRSYDWWAGIHCDGIICLLKSNDGFASEVLVCNPALQEFKLVPGSMTNKSFTSGGMGFGYDCRTNNYKLVRIVHNDRRRVKAEVHILGTNSWRRLNVAQGIRVQDQSRYLHLKGVCYWLVMIEASGECKVLCFNVSGEMFYFIPFPDSEMDYASFFVWNDSFALFLCNQERENPDLASYEMWVMTEYDDIVKGACPWTKHLVIGPLKRTKKFSYSGQPLDGFPIPEQFCKRDELLFRNDGRLLSYNLHSQKLRDIGVAGWNHDVRIRFYVKSLVSVKARENTA